VVFPEYFRIQDTQAHRVSLIGPSAAKAGTSLLRTRRIDRAHSDAFGGEDQPDLPDFLSSGSFRVVQAVRATFAGREV
jgi:hypothetical protein